MNKLKTFHLTAEHILYGISIANALRLAWAYATADANGNVLSVPGAFGMLLGSCVSAGTAFVAGKLGGKLTKLRTTIAWTVLITLLVLEPFVLAPITMTHMSEGMRTLLGPVMSWVWSVVLALVPSLVLAGVSIANGGLVEGTLSKPHSEVSEALSGAENGSAKKSRRSKSLKVAAAKIPCRYSPQCDRTFESQNAANAHARTCGFKPTIAILEENKINKGVNHE